MPNIGIHGYNELRANQLMHEIKTVLRGCPDANEVVMTVDPNRVVNLAGRPTPYLSVSSTEPDSLGEMLERLKKIGEDIEVRPLARWIPASRT